jgi:hypothetical protein
VSEPPPQHSVSLTPFDAVSYGMYIEARLSGTRLPRSLEEPLPVDRFENEGRRLLPATRMPGAEAHAADEGELPTLRRNARTTRRSQLTALVEAHGWTAVGSTTYEKAGWPRLEIPAVLANGDALAVITAVVAASAGGGE